MANHRLRDFYTQKAGLYQRFFVDFLKWEKVLETFFQANPYLFSGMKILDAGCGTGSVTRVLHRLAGRQGFGGITFHAFDLTPAMLELFRQWMEKEELQDIRLRQADVLELESQLPDEWTAYDLIVSSALLEYIPKDQINLALNNLRRRLDRKSRLLVFLTRRTGIAKWTGAKWWGTNLFDPHEIDEALRQAGFSNVQFKQLPAYWNAFILAVEAKSSF